MRGLRRLRTVVSPSFRLETRMNPLTEKLHGASKSIAATISRAVVALALVAVVAVSSGCASGPPSDALIQIPSTEGGRWIPKEMTERYTCEIGVLVCSAAVGRLGTRRCQCNGR
jgi:hypothetical protein